MLDIRIKNAGSLAKEAFSYLNDLQKGVKQILKTGQDFIDCHIGGLLPSDVLLFAAQSGVGKTKLLFDTLDLILDEKVNPNAANIVSLEYSLEMKFLNKILRDANKLTKKKKGDILISQFTEEEQDIMRRYYEGLKDNRRYVCEEPISMKEFYSMTDDFCKMHEDKDAIIVSLDHVLLLQGEDDLGVLTTYINILRKKYANLYFILLSQLNRGSMEVIKERDNSMMPTTRVIYGSSHFEFLSSYIVVIVDPFKMGIHEYLKVNRDRYDWLNEFMTCEDNKGKVSFDMLGNMAYFVLKTRESDHPYKNLFIRKMDLTSEQIERMKQTTQTDTPTVQAMPVFDTTTYNPNSSALLAAKGGEFETPF